MMSKEKVNVGDLMQLGQILSLVLYFIQMQAKIDHLTFTTGTETLLCA